MSAKVRADATADAGSLMEAAWVILVLNQYKCSGCSPGKHPDTRTMVTVLDDDSRDNVHGRCLCIAV